VRLRNWDAAAGDWPAVKLNALRYLAVNPLTAVPYHFSPRLCDN